MLWGNIDYQSGNNKPKFANTSNTYIGSTSIGGSKANTSKYWGWVHGVSVTEAANTTGDGKKVAHAGWVSQKIGTGGRAGRIQYETLVAMGSITGDDPTANTYFPGP
jgi:hypothetical protein